ncbi:hypothetical protein MPSEU_000919600 [Mayamaea pseudoterrestris]|nr:hypothetical protein MPSEU_000919600 [Mayamaea pseudoterrestris]
MRPSWIVKVPKLLATLFIVILLESFIVAYPIGAGGCGGSGSVGGIHLTADSITTGQLEDYGIKVIIAPEDDSLLDEDPEVQLSNGYVKNILVGRPYYIQMTAASANKAFRGFLFRITSSLVDTDGSFTVPNSLSATDQAQEQIAQVCSDIGIGGLTHTNNTLKETAAATLLLDDEGRDIYMEITAVIMNRQENGVTMSEYYWNSYTINVVTNSSELVAATNPPVATDDAAASGGELAVVTSWVALVPPLLALIAFLMR